MSTTNEFEQKALLYAEKYGIIDYVVIGDKMIYKEILPTEGTYEATVDLNTMSETRKKLK